MKTALIALTTAASLTAITTANAGLGDTEQALTQHYGTPLAVETSNGDIPTQKGYYVELKEAFATNVSLIADSRNNYNMDLVETRQRSTFMKDGLRIVAYVGNPGEKYNGVDFAGASSREVISCPIVWRKNRNGDQVGLPSPFSQQTLQAILEANQGNSTWDDHWQILSIPGVYIRKTADKSRLAIAYGTSELDIQRLELRMVDEPGKTAD